MCSRLLDYFQPSAGDARGMRRQEGLELAPLLECHTERSECHPPLFILVAHKNHGILATLFENGLQLTPEISAEHMLLPPEGQLPGGQTFRPDFARQSLPGVTESASLLMCAACVGNVTAIRQLLAAGVLLRCLTASCL